MSLIGAQRLVASRRHVADADIGGSLLEHVRDGTDSDPDWAWIPRNVLPSATSLLLLLLISTALVFATPAPANASPWSESIEVSGRLQQPYSKVLRTPDGSLVVAWQGLTLSGNENVLQARRLSGLDLGPIVEIARGDIGSEFQMAAAADGTVRFVWTASISDGALQITVLRSRQLSPNGTLSAVQDVFPPIYDNATIGGITDFGLIVHPDGSSLIAGLSFDSIGGALRLRRVSAANTMDPIRDIRLGASASSLKAVRAPDGATTLLWEQGDDGEAGPGLRAMRVGVDGTPSDIQTITTDASARRADLAVAPDGMASAVWVAQAFPSVIVRARRFRPGESVLPSVDVATESYYGTGGSSNYVAPFLSTVAGGDGLVVWRGEDPSFHIRARIIPWTSGAALPPIQHISTVFPRGFYKDADGSFVVPSADSRQGIRLLRILPDGTHVSLPERPPDPGVSPNILVDYLALGPQEQVAAVWPQIEAGGADNVARVRLSYGDMAGSVPPRPPPPPSSPPTRPSGSAIPVVLVPGWLEDNPTVLPGQPCPPRADFTALCLTLQRARHPVYLIGAKPGGGRLTLDDHGAVDPNARRLVKFMRDHRIGAALVVGHSMGGLVARVAMARHAAPAVGLVTLGTPHDGSFGADALEWASKMYCFPTDLRCLAIRAAVTAYIAINGPAAIQDLTSDSRSRDNARLTAISSPVRAYAGTAVASWAAPGYWVPNDEIVGQTSAWGREANIGPGLACYSGDLWHGRYNKLHQYRPNNLFDAEQTRGLVLKAATLARPSATDRSRCGGTNSARGATSRSTKSVVRRPGPPRRGLIELFAARSRRAHAGERLAPTRSRTVLSRRSFSARCAGHTLAAVELAPRVFALNPTQASCPKATLAGGASVSILVSDDAPRARASIKRKGKRLTIEIVARKRIQRAYLQSGRRRVRLKTKGRRARARLGGSIDTKRAALTAIIGGRHYTTALPRTL